jgi:predicted permease
MHNIVLLGACFVIGMLLRQSGRLPANAHTSLNGFIIHISLPALTLLSVHRLAFDKALLAPAAMAWIMFGLGCAFFWWIGRMMKLRAPTIGALMLTGSLANTSFIGVPMIEAYFGGQGVGLGLLIDQAGTYLVLSTLGMLIATIYAQGRMPTARAIAKKVFTFAPFIAFIAAFLLIPVTYPAWVEVILDRLGGTLVPLALVSVGLQIQFSEARGRVGQLTLGLAFKLIAAPLVIGLLYAGLLGGRGEMIQIIIFEAAMPPQIGAAIVAMDHNLDPQLVTLMVGIGIPLSFLTLFAWRQVLSVVA